MLVVRAMQSMVTSPRQNRKGQGKQKEKAIQKEKIIMPFHTYLDNDAEQKPSTSLIRVSHQSMIYRIFQRLPIQNCARKSSYPRVALMRWGR
jgi:hypothetical protein